MYKNLNKMYKQPKQNVCKNLNKMYKQPKQNV